MYIKLFSTGDYSCAVGNNIYQQDKCFLIVPFPSVKWEEARQACRTAQVIVLRIAKHTTCEC